MCSHMNESILLNEGSFILRNYQEVIPFLWNSQICETI